MYVYVINTVVNPFTPDLPSMQIHEPGRAKVLPSLFSYFKTLSIGLVLGIKLATSRSAVMGCPLPTELNPARSTFVQIL